MKPEVQKMRRKLDNAALVFPAATGKKDSRVFRIYCKLGEPVDPEILQKALERILQRYPMFQSVLKRGGFWFYLEKKDIQSVVKEEENTPCSPIYKKRQETLLFEISYRGKRINLEIFHVLTDGTGAIHFLSELVAAYLNLKYGIEEQEYQRISEKEQEEDSFSRYYSSANRPKQVRKSTLAYQIGGNRLQQADMRITECVVSARQLLEKVREKGVSITVYMTAILLLVIAAGMKAEEKKRPVVIMVPVNLRKYFDSNSMSNFFGWMEIEYYFKPDTTFEQVLAHVKKRFAEELTKEQVALRMNRLIDIEKNPMLRMFPLELKNLGLRIGSWMGSRNVTAIFSNLGKVTMPEIYRQFIDRFGVMTSTDKLQICACSYYDRFYFSITTKYAETKVQERLLAFLRQEGIQVREMQHGMRQNKKEGEKS